MKSILLHVYNDNGFEQRMQVALDLARAADAHLTMLQVETVTVAAAMPMGTDFGAELAIKEIQAADGAFREKVEAHLAHEDVRWDWLLTLGDAADQIIRHSAFADLVIVSQAGQAGDLDGPLPVASEVALHSPTATLVVPPSVNRFDPQQPVVVGWDGSNEAARAMRFAMPLLRMAGSVHLASVGHDNRELPKLEASAYLARHGISSELHELPAGVRDVGDILQAFAIDKGASAIVMGAYGHSRLRETLFGGVTRSMIRNSTVPLVMSH